MSVKFEILGTGAGPGVPSYFCDCIACREAREDPRLARTRSGAVIHTGKETILIDASPDLRSQLVRAGIRSLDYVFVTHWHYDHFGGLGDLEFYVRLGRKSPIKLFLPPEAVEEYLGAYPFLHDVFELVPWQFETNYCFQGITLLPLPAVHSVQTAGLLLLSEQKETKIAYFTDTAGLPLTTMEKVQKADYLICDATFHGDNWYPHSHMSVEEAINLGRELQAKETILTHLAMHYSTPVSVGQLEERLKCYPNVRLAFDGMAILI